MELAPNPPQQPCSAGRWRKAALVKPSAWEETGQSNTGKTWTCLLALQHKGRPPPHGSPRPTHPQASRAHASPRTPSTSARASGKEAVRKPRCRRHRPRSRLARHRHQARLRRPRGGRGRAPGLAAVGPGGQRPLPPPHLPGPPLAVRGERKRPRAPSRPPHSGWCLTWATGGTDWARAGLPEHLADCSEHHFAVESSFGGLAKQNPVCGGSTVVPKHDVGAAARWGRPVGAAARAGLQRTADTTGCSLGQAG